MRDFRAAAIQMNALLADTEGNLTQIERWTEAAAAEGARIVCFPELAITGHMVSGEILDVAEPVPDGSSCRRLAALAEEFGCLISAGLAEREAGIVYNTQVIVGREGYIGKQRKLHMSADEYFHYRAGATVQVIETDLCRLGIGICYDTVFPETMRIAALKGAEVYLAPHAARCGQWSNAASQRRKVATARERARMTFRSRAFDNGMHVIYCNQAGRAGQETSHAGGILFVDPHGRVLAESETAIVEDEMVVCDMEEEAFEARRRERCFNLQTRRPEIYGELCRVDD